MVGRGPGPGRRHHRVRLAPLPLRDGLRHRVRPSQHHLRALHQDVVPLLRPGADGAADLPGELGHPLGPDVHDLRADDPRAVLHRRGGLRLHALDRRRPGLRRHGHHAVRVPRRRADAEVDVPGLVADPGPPGRRGHHRRRERQRGAGGEVVRRRGQRAARPGQGGRPGPVGLREGRRPPRPLVAGHAEPAPARAWPWSCSSAATWSSTASSGSAPSSPSTPTCSCSRRRSSCSG